MAERRGSPRERLFLSGSIAFNNRNSTADCFIRNWSEEGAKIVIARTEAAPREFDLVVPARRESRRALLVWRQGDEAGVRFSPRPAAPRPDPALARNRAREADSAY